MNLVVFGLVPCLVPKKYLILDEVYKGGIEDRRNTK